MQRQYTCDCSALCMRGGRTEPKTVGKTTYHAHASYRNEDRLRRQAARMGLPAPSNSTVPPPLASGSRRPHFGSPSASPPHKRQHQDTVRPDSDDEQDRRSTPPTPPQPPALLRPHSTPQPPSSPQSHSFPQPPSPPQQYPRQPEEGNMGEGRDACMDNPIDSDDDDVCSMLACRVKISLSHNKISMISLTLEALTTLINSRDSRTTRMSTGKPLGVKPKCLWKRMKYKQPSRS